MSVLVEITEDGLDRLYFRVINIEGEYFVERPDRSAIHLPEGRESESIIDTVTLALAAIKREDEKWASLQAETHGVRYPDT